MTTKKTKKKNNKKTTTKKATTSKKTTTKKKQMTTIASLSMQLDMIRIDIRDIKIAVGAQPPVQNNVTVQPAQPVISNVMTDPMQMGLTAQTPQPMQPVQTPQADAFKIDLFGTQTPTNGQTDVTLDQLKQILQEIAATPGGLDRVTDIVAKHGAARVADLTADKYNSVIVAARSHT